MKNITIEKGKATEMSKNTKSSSLEKINRMNKPLIRQVNNKQT